MAKLTAGLDHRRFNSCPGLQSLPSCRSSRGSFILETRPDCSGSNWLAIATLLDKPEKRLRPVRVAYVGFQIPDEFVVGYGLDFAEDYRNLSDICVLAED